MKNHQKRRGILAGLGAMAAAGALVLGGAVAQAAPLPMPSASGVVITKLEQPAVSGDAADGQPLPSLPSAPIDGVTFEAYPVTVPGGHTVGSNAWQEALADVTLAQAQAEVGNPATVAAVRDGETADGGVIEWQTGSANTQGNDLPAGLYLVRETVTPEGVVAAGDFLLAVPLTDPDNLNAWLDDIYVYPKNAKVDATKTVENVDDLKVGDVVTWTIDAAIPDVRDSNDDIIPTDAFEIWDELTDTELALAPAYNAGGGNTGIRVSVDGTDLDEGDDYTVARAQAGGKTTYKVVLTADGRQAMADALTNNASARISVEIDTTVLKIGEFENEGQIYPNQKTLTDETPVTTDPAEVKYGKVQLNKTSSNGALPAADLAGAQFKVYATKADADASNANNLKPADPDPVDANYDSTDGIWTTPSGGQVVISGLRYSDFADGEAQTKFQDVTGQTCVDYNVGDDGTTCEPNPKFQTYWLVEVTALDGHQLLSEPIEFTVNAATTALTSQQTVENQENRNGFVLPLTGGMGTAFLTIGGLALLALVLIVARRRRETEAAE